MNTINVNDLLDNLDKAASKDKNVGKKPKQDNDWAEDEDNQFALGRDETNAASKSKTTKKKTTTKGWGEVKQEEPKAEPIVAPVQDTQKKGIMKLINRDAPTASAPKVDLGGELFPELGGVGQPIKKKEKRPEPVPVSKPETETNNGGPRRFLNAKKVEKGEHFVPLDPNLAPKVLPEVVEHKVTPQFERKEHKEQKEEKPQTQIQTEKVETTAPKRDAGIFKRNEEAVKEIIPEDSKFKFGEGPKKFAGGQKISFKREEEKSDLEEMRLKKEREVEARLQKERDEAAKEREQWKASKEQRKEEQPPVQSVQTSDEKKPVKFSNHKKEGEPRPPKKVVEEKPQAPVEKPAEIKEEAQPKQPVEKIEVTGTLSKKGWGEGAILKKSAKK